jgi:hypothetical protein
MASIETRFVQSDTLGLHLRTRDQAEFKRLVVEAKSILDSELGPLNNFSMNLLQSANVGAGGFLGGSTLAGVQECRALIEGAVNHIRRRPAPAQMPSSGRPVHYVDASRLGTLRSLTGNPWDVTRLVQLCDELNIAYANNCFMATAMLVRSIVDHVPPVFGCKSFNEVESSYPGAKSFRSSMKHLNQSLRNIADAHLHVQIRAKEVVPSAAQVDFRADLDVLLAEVIRVLR